MCIVLTSFFDASGFLSGREFYGVVAKRPPNSKPASNGQRLLSIFYPDDGSMEHNVDEVRLIRRI